MSHLLALILPDDDSDNNSQDHQHHHSQHDSHLHILVPQVLLNLGRVLAKLPSTSLHVLHLFLQVVQVGTTLLGGGDVLVHDTGDLVELAFDTLGLFHVDGCGNGFGGLWFGAGSWCFQWLARGPSSISSSVFLLPKCPKQKQITVVNKV